MARFQSEKWLKTFRIWVINFQDWVIFHGMVYPRNFPPLVRTRDRHGAGFFRSLVDYSGGPFLQLLFEQFLILQKSKKETLSEEKVTKISDYVFLFRPFFYCRTKERNVCLFLFAGCPPIPRFEFSGVTFKFSMFLLSKTLQI